MTVSLALAVYGVVLALAAPAVWGPWAARSPRIAVSLVYALMGASLLAVALAGATAAVPLTSVSTTLGGLLGACATALTTTYGSAHSAVAATVGILISIGIVARAVGCVAAHLWRTRSARRRHRAMLDLVARPLGVRGVSVVETDTAAAYCLPGRRGRVVVTSAALQALSNDQLDAVLAHERAHGRGRHHLLVALSEGLVRAFPRVPLFELAGREVPRLVELLADDIAARAAPRSTVASALVSLADSRTPDSALAASGAGAVVRVRRLLAPARPIHRWPALAIMTVTMLAVLAPAAAATVPAWETARLNYCPIIWS